MKTICLYFQVHQPFRLRRYRFFEIGNDHYYYDDYSNESIMHKVADKCYLPANKVLLSLIREYGEKFKVSFSISGVALDQFELYTPDVLKSFKELADTGCVEFLSETYSHSLVSLKNEQEFKNQVEKHKMKIKELFGQEPTVFRNTELVYSDDIGAMVAKMGYQAMLTEGAKHILGWKSPNYLYCNTINPKLKVLLKNFKLSDDIAFRFGNKEWSEYPLTAEKYVSWLQDMNKDEEIINLFMDYETFGEHQWADTGIFKFLESFPKVALSKRKFSFSTPSEVAKNHQPVSAIQAPYPVSWADAERDLTAWLGNELQTDAFNTLYELTEKVSQSDDPTIHQDWEYLQCSDHFYYMCTKFFSDGDVHSYFNPYDTPYDAYINYMNILNDFIIRVNASVPETTQDKEVARLSTLIREKDKQLEKYEAEIKRLTKRKTPVRKKAALTKAAESSKKSTSKKTAPKSTKGSKIKGTK